MTSKKGKWKKLLSALLACVLAVSFTGCSSGSDDSSDSSSDSSDTSEENVNTRKIGYIFREKVDDGGFAGQMAHERERASNRSSIDTCYVDNVSVGDFENAVKKLAEAGCTDIVSGSSTYVNMLNTLAKKYLDLNFINFGTMTDSLNVTAYSEAMYEGAYVAGLVADYNSQSKKIGVVVDPSLDMVVPVINAVQLGSLLNQDGGSFVYAASAARSNEIRQAIDEMIGKGCDIIVCYTCSDYAAGYCEEKNVKYIGSLDYNGSEDDHPNMLMYFCARRDSYFLAQFKSLKMDTWESDSYIGAMSNGIINVSSAFECSKDGTQHLMDALVPYITNGTARPFKGLLRDAEGNIAQLETDEMNDRKIASMDWYVENVEYIGNYRAPQTDVESTELEIKS